MSVTDMCGTEIKIDDLLAFSVQTGYSTYIRIGRVVEVNDLKSTVRCEWLRGKDYRTNKASWIQHPGTKTLILPPDYLKE